MTGKIIADPLIGIRLGDYVIQELLGRGGMARVYRGQDVILGRQAAIKILDITTEEAQDDRVVERFKLEARAIAGFDHPNIISVYQFGATDELFFIAMKLVRGETLAQVLRECERKYTFLPTERVLAIVRDISAALDYAHSWGIVHRDIKPANILFDATANDRAILTDFGLAMEIGGATTLGTAFGTPRYIAPEQAVASLHAVPQSDIYSLAVVVYEMLTGQVPFQDSSPINIALQHITDEPPHPCSLNPDIPEEVATVLLHALAKEPEDRYSTAGDFYRALEKAYLEAEVELPTMALPPDPGTRPLVTPHGTARFPDRRAPASAAARQPRRRWWRWALPLALVIIGGLVGAWALSGRDARVPLLAAPALQSNLAPAAATALAAIPPEVALTLELVYDADRFALHNLTDYPIPLDGLLLMWDADAGRTQLAGETLGSPLPPGQCAWLRLLSNGTLQPPTGCPVPTHYLRLLRDPADLFWARSASFEVLYAGQPLATCQLDAGRCSVVLPRQVE